MTKQISAEKFEELYGRIGEEFPEGILVSVGTDGETYEATFAEIEELKAQHETRNGELFPVPKKRGRPKTGTAKTGAERQRAYRVRKPQMTVAQLFQTLQRVPGWMDATEQNIKPANRQDQLSRRFAIFVGVMKEKLVEIGIEEQVAERWVSEMMAWNSES